MQFNKTTLGNGLRIVTVPMPNSLSATVMVLVETGSNYESKDENGISHLLEHMVFKGTPRRPGPTDISHELDSIGAESNAYTNHQSTGYHAKVAKRHADIALDIIADMFLHPKLDPVELEKEKGVIIEEMRMYRDRPEAVVGDAFMELVYGDQPAGRKVIGEEAIVRAITRERLAAYHGSHYVAEATTVVVAGGIDEASIIASVEKAFAGIPTAKKSPKPAVHDIQNAPAAAIAAKTTDQTHLVLGVRSVPVGDERRYALLVLGTLLGGGFSSRLFVKLREQMGVCYYIYAENSFFIDHGLFTVSAGVDNKRVEEVLEAIMAELRLLRENKPSEAELTKVKNYWSGKFALSLETSDALASYAGSDELFERRIEDPADAIAKIQAVTAEEVMSVAQDIFIEKNLNLALIGPYQATDADRFKKPLSFKK
jgi:predicted Zn-dependent peptidase